MQNYYLYFLLLLILYIFLKGLKQVYIDITNYLTKYKNRQPVNKQYEADYQEFKEKLDSKKSNIRNRKKIPIKEVETLKSKIKKEHIPIKKIIGIGGGGCNIAECISYSNKDTYDILLINSDKNALNSKKSDHKVYLKKSDPYGCGGNTKCGFNLIDNRVINELRNFIFKEKEVYLIATLGGGVGSGSTKAIAKYLHNSKIKTNVIFIKPFSWEGKHKQKVAQDTLKYLKQYANNIYSLNNDDLVENYSHLSISQCFTTMNNTVDKIIKSQN